MLLRCKSLEPPMFQLGQQRPKTRSHRRARSIPDNCPYVAVPRTAEECHNRTLIGRRRTSRAPLPVGGKRFHPLGPRSRRRKLPSTNCGG
jgi:hypothetical protein